MPLSEKQLEEMYKSVIKDNTNITWMREELEKGGKKFREQDRRINKIEGEQSLLKGKLGAFVLFLTLCGTIMVHGIGWLLSHLWKT